MEARELLNRKDQHVEIAQRLFKEAEKTDFDDLKFVYNSLPEMSLEDVSIETSFAGFNLKEPFFINAITGGSANTKAINEKLAIVAKETGLAMSSGSLSAALKDDSLRDSFEILRKINDDGLVFANLGAEYDAEMAKKAVDILEADALQIHLNPIQELIMAEGDRDFSSWLKNIESIVKEVHLPVIVKDVGFGMSRETIKKLIDIGVSTIDVSGSGGTNFASIENYRREDIDYAYLESLGQSTAISLFEAQEYLKDVEIIASGGIRNPLDIVKSLALGAGTVGLAGFFLNMVLENGVENTIERINSWKEEIKVIMTILGKKDIGELVYTDILVTGQVRDWCLGRQIPYLEFSNRARNRI